MTDRELIRKVHKGEREALNEIIGKYYDELYRFCFYLTGHETDSYDITQEVFLRFIRYVDGYKSKNLKGWLLIIARNLCMDYFRQGRRYIVTDEIEEAEGEEKELSRVERSIDIMDALQKIPMEQREVLVMRAYGELKFEEIARATGCKLSTVKSRYRLGIEAMRREMKKADEQS